MNEAAEKKFLRLLSIAVAGYLAKRPRHEGAQAEFLLRKDVWSFFTKSPPPVTVYAAEDEGGDENLSIILTDARRGARDRVIKVLLSISGEEAGWSLNPPSYFRWADIYETRCSDEEAEREVAMFFTPPYAVRHVSDRAIAVARELYEREVPRERRAPSR